MTTQFDFSNDDWDRVAAAPLLVGMAVAKAEDSGFVGSFREHRSLLAHIAEGATGSPAQELIAEAATTDTSVDYEAYKVLSADALAVDAEEACRQLARTLAAVVEPEVADGYKRWTVEVAESVAQAAREGGQRVSPGEVAMIERVTEALGLNDEGSSEGSSD